LIVTKNHIIPILLFIFYTVGIIGISIPQFRLQVIGLTPLNLLLTAFLMLWGMNGLSMKVFYAILFSFLIGYTIEVFGVASGILFGEYNYGKPLGWKFLDVPVIIGVNWLILSFSSLGFIGKFIINPWLKVVFASLLMVALDVLIEPVAIHLDFWTWAETDVPFQNYLMWFIAALGINSIVCFLVKEIDFKTSAFVFLSQVYFFTFLNLTI
tara:strand:+ start:528 stop:1160 length:633 start_codon:yes stop_codon:yes gene_type:complete